MYNYDYARASKYTSGLMFHYLPRLSGDIDEAKREGCRNRKEASNQYRENENPEKRQNSCTTKGETDNIMSYL